MPRNQSVIVPAATGWYACLMASTAGIPPDKRPIVAWLIYESHDGDHTVMPITLSENRNTCWGNSDDYFYVTPDGTYYSHESMGPYFDTEAEATAYAIEKEKAFDQRAATWAKEAERVEPKRCEDEIATWQFTWMNGELQFQLLLKSLDDDADDPTVIECRPAPDDVIRLRGALQKRYDSDTVVDGTINSAGECEYHARNELAKVGRVTR